METTSTRINQAAASPPYRIHHCSRCNNDSFHILTGHGYVNAIVCENCDSLQIDYGMVRRSASTVQPDDPMHGHTSVYEPSDLAPTECYDSVSGGGAVRYGATSEVHTGYDYQFASYLAGYIAGYTAPDQGDIPGEVYDSACLVAVRTIISNYLAGDWTG